MQLRQHPHIPGFDEFEKTIKGRKDEDIFRHLVNVFGVLKVGARMSPFARSELLDVLDDVFECKRYVETGAIAPSVLACRVHGAQDNVVFSPFANPTKHLVQHKGHGHKRGASLERASVKCGGAALTADTVGLLEYINAIARMGKLN
jgi:hypothetical protein